MVLLALTVLVLGASAGMALEALWSRLRVGRLDHQPPPEGERLPRVSVIVPAHNEEAALEGAARTLLRQDYPDLEIVLVDDRSTDATGVIMDGLAQEDPRVCVLHVRELPPGWMGKNHALWLGAQAATGEWLLFTDADVHMDPSVVGRAVGYALRRGLDHLTVAPLLEARGLLLAGWMGLFTFVYVATRSPHRAEDPRTRGSVGIGAFNLIRRDAYEGIGTYRALALRPDDDVQLGRLVKQRGYRQGVLVSGGLVRVAWYRSLGEALRGLEKNALTGMGYRWDVAVGATCFLALVTLFPWLALGLGGQGIWALAAAAVLAQAAGYLLANPPALWRGVLVYPLAAALLVYGVARALVRTAARGGICWGGRFYPLAELRRGAAGPPEGR